MINATVQGNIGGEIKFRMLDSGTALLAFSVASNDKRKVGGSWQDVTTWVRVSMFGKQAEGLHPHLSRGSSVVVGGALTEREYTTSDGEKRTSLDMDGKLFAFGGRKGESSGGEQPSSGQPPADDFGDDDIPF